MTKAEIVELTSREPEKTFEEMLVTIGDSLSDLATSDDEEDGEDEDDEETEQGKDESGCVMGTITQMVQQYMERCRQKQMELHESTHPGCEDAADYSHEQEKMHGTSKLRVSGGVQPQTDDNAPAPPLTTFGEHMECCDIVPGISQMPQETSQPESSHIRLGPLKVQSKSRIVSG
jgi:hypothetical protein